MKLRKPILISLAVVIGLPVLFLAMGYTAVRWDFWPPSCSVLPIPQARRTCAFSKLPISTKTAAAAPDFEVAVSADNALPARKVVFMYDTWTINYNFNFFEDTRHNVDSAFTRVKQLGANEVDVFSFVEATGDTSEFELRPVATPYKYLRDAAITAADMKKLAAAGKANGLGVVIHYNVQADYASGLTMADVAKAGSGQGGDAAHRRAATVLGTDADAKTEAWVARWMDGLESSLLTMATDAESAGIYGLDITPHYLTPSFAPHDALADERFQAIVTKLRSVYHGKLFGSNTGGYGGFSARPRYVDSLDGLYVDMPWVTSLAPDADVAALRTAHAANLATVLEPLQDYKKDLVVVITQASFDQAVSGTPFFEFNDYAEGRAKGYVADGQLQARSYQGFFEALNARPGLAGVAANNYWWDDFTDPDYADPLISMSFSIRNKPAEAVVTKWWQR